DAFTKASRELQNEQIDKALAEGRITQQMADWMKARPDNGAVGIPFKGGMRGFGGRFGGKAPAAAPAQ
ncbi:MAG: hypothetical protein Q8R28_04440, partial [Dehalococcoidia bacterium]|nr:hypothetical protein [Dehalococcoidia bacterium]